MVFEKRVPSQFGIIAPRDNDVYWKKQGGGMSPTQYTLEGVYIPIGKLNYRLGDPDWAPDGPEFGDKLRELDLTEIPERDYKSLPEPVKEQNQFRTTEEYLNWIEDSEWYGHVDLWSDLYRFTYGMFDRIESDPRERWDDIDDLWFEINKQFSFYYEELSYEEYMDVGGQEYPPLQNAIRPIQIKGSKSNVNAKWADELDSQIVFLMCPNAE